MGNDSGARLTRANGETITFVESCMIGRSSRSGLMLQDSRVSRSHAIIHQQGEGDFWVLDLGSSNGTRLNGKLIVQPCRLEDGDCLLIGSEELHFFNPGRKTPDIAETLAGSTMRTLRISRQWLLLADLVEFTPLSQRLEPAELAKLVGGWMNDCRLIVEENGGAIHKYLGDGWFGGWEDDGAIDEVARCLKSLLKLQKAASPAFRIVIHLGEVTSSGSPAGSELGMLGPDVNLLFRMEKLAGDLTYSFLASKAAANRLQESFTLCSLGSYKFKGFGSEEIECFRIV